MSLTFKGGVFLQDTKALTRAKPIETLYPPLTVVLPVPSLNGESGHPTVSVGERVFLGQPIAAAPERSAPIHATISGVVRAIERVRTADDSETAAIVIDSDGHDELDFSVAPIDADALTPEQMIERIREGGIVGLDGTELGAHVKLRESLQRVDTLIVNGAESEPYLTAEHRLMLERPEELVHGILLILRILGIRNALIGIEADKSDVFPVLQAHLPADGSIRLAPLRCKYPQSAERVLVRTLTGRAIPTGKKPVDVRCTVFSAAECLAIADLFRTGIPLIERVITVSGPAAAEAKNVRVRIGTMTDDLLERCGGLNDTPALLLTGGPMTGAALENTAVPIEKKTNAILAFGEKDATKPEQQACVRCGQCIGSCPMELPPIWLYDAIRADKAEESLKLGLLDCIGCGVCSYICPSGLPLAHTILEAQHKSDESEGAV